MAQAKKRKRFFDVKMPLVGKETQLQAYTIEETQGKYIKYDLTRALRGKSVEVQLKVKVNDKGEASAHPVKITLMPYYLKRMVRKGTNYVEDSFSTNCKDAQVKIKPFIVTRRKVSRAVRKALREKMRDELIAYVKNKTAESIFGDIVKNDLQKPLSLKLKKIYPLSLCEIRVFKIEKLLDKKEEKPAKEEAPKKKVEEKSTKEESEAKETKKDKQ